MNNGKIIKELFILQNDYEKLEIINSFNLSFDGFSSINRKKLMNNKNIIISKLTSQQNIFKIEKKIKSELRNDENEFDYLLSPEKVVEKYGHNFTYLLKIFYKDKYGEQTIKILSILKEKSETNENEMNKNSNDDKDGENEILKLRKIIIELQKKVSIRELKIEELASDKQINQKRIIELENVLKMKENKLSDLRNDLDIWEERLSNKNKEIVEINRVLENSESKIDLLTKEVEKYKNQLKQKIHIIGMPKEIDNYNNNTIKIYYNEEIDKFVEQYKKNPNDIYYIFKPNITSYTNRQISKNTNAIIIKNKNELSTIIEKVEKNE